jgi:hypothetical protein
VSLAVCTGREVYFLPGGWGRWESPTITRFVGKLLLYILNAMATVLETFQKFKKKNLKKRNPFRTKDISFNNNVRLDENFYTGRSAQDQNTADFVCSPFECCWRR